MVTLVESFKAAYYRVGCGTLLTLLHERNGTRCTCILRNNAYHSLTLLTLTYALLTNWRSPTCLLLRGTFQSLDVKHASMSLAKGHNNLAWNFLIRSSCKGIDPCGSLTYRGYALLDFENSLNRRLWSRAWAPWASRKLGNMLAHTLSLFS